jgi:hypothetical protein
MYVVAGIRFPRFSILVAGSQVNVGCEINVVLMRNYREPQSLDACVTDQKLPRTGPRALALRRR